MDMNMESLVFDRIHRKNTIVLKTDKNEYHLLLRWKNHQGILNSAWQVSITPCKINTPKERKKSISEPFTPFLIYTLEHLKWDKNPIKN